MSANKNNARFLREQSQVIRETDNHPLSFLLGSDGELMTLSNGYRNYYDAQSGAIFEGRANEDNCVSLSTRESSLEAAETLGCSVSVDACHVVAGSHGGTYLALGIAERNRADGYTERETAIENEVVEVGGVPVFKRDLQEWSEFGLCDKELADSSPPSDGRAFVNSEEMKMSMFDGGKRKTGNQPEFQSGDDNSGDDSDPFGQLSAPETGEALRQSEMLPNATLPEADVQSTRCELVHPDHINEALYGALGECDQQAQESLRKEVSIQNFDSYCQDAIASKPDSVSLYLNTETRRSGEELSGISYSLEGVQGDSSTSLINMDAWFSREGDSIQCDSNIMQENEFSALSEIADMSQGATTVSDVQNSDVSTDLSTGATDFTSDAQQPDTTSDIPPEPQKDTSSDF